jgi:hypothetical protein
VISSAILPPRSPGARKAASSKYDYVKIKVWLGDNLEHYYILSRYLISRMLTVTKVPQDKVRPARQRLPCTLARPYTTQLLTRHPRRP